MAEQPEPTSSQQANTVGYARASSVVSSKIDDSSFQLFAKTMEQTRMAVCLTDPQQDDNPIVFANRAFLELSGYDEDEVVGRNCRFMQGPDTSEQTLQTLRDAIRDESVVVVEILNYRKDGTTFWNALHLGPLYDEAGKLRYLFGSQWDVSDVHLAREGENQARLLARELSHRMKNMLAVISSVITLTGRHRDAVPVTEEINDRIRALARAYDTTLDNATDQRVSLVPLLEAVLRPYGLDEDANGDGGGPRIQLEGADVDMPGVTVSVLGLTLHELAAKAVKHGALSGRNGGVVLSWQHEEGPKGAMLVLTWCETGGPRILDEADGGTGSGVVGNLLRAARGTIGHDWRPEGLVVTLALPLEP